MILLTQEELEDLKKRVEIAKEREKDLEEGYRQAKLYYNWKKKQYFEAMRERGNLSLLLNSHLENFNKFNKETHN